ncbi:hypothetical protein M413DRAFT_31685 [Hebeloma cylindrosporum]|uniref:HNH nuclease domain-containing protein n=1 Tax=Hebeloma cylindrosporum TaxID=76867 RepID=A0A0C2Y5X6_HEBCY|nr:hypothetical protein M413DRAFT_31685 [Hebeloma cylindrosporum h7]
MTALPSQVPEELQSKLHVVRAYNICLTLERSQIQNDTKTSNVHELECASNTGLIYSRILGYLIHFLPTQQGIEDVCTGVLSCADDEAALLDLGKMYFDYFIRAFRAKKDGEPVPTYYEPFSERPSYERFADMPFVEAPQNDADAKNNALFRDQFRCIVTGRYDSSLVFQNKELYEICDSAESNAKIGVLQCAHIFTASTNEDTDAERGSDNAEGDVSMWGLLKRFGYPRLREELTGHKVHRLENLMTLSCDFHHFFDTLWVWFVATDEKDTYKIECTHPLFHREYPEYVTFTTTDKVKLPVPSPVYLAIHAAYMEERKILDPDGASAETLEHALRKLEVSRS